MRFHEICWLGWLLVGPRRLDGHYCRSPPKSRGSTKIHLIVFTHPATNLLIFRCHPGTTKSVLICWKWIFFLLKQICFACLCSVVKVAAFNLTDLKVASPIQIHLPAPLFQVFATLSPQLLVEIFRFLSLKQIVLCMYPSGRGGSWSERNFLKHPLTTWDLS